MLKPRAYRVIRIDRFEQRTPYPVLADEVKKRVERPPLAAHKTGMWVSADGTRDGDTWEYPSVLVMDADGVGTPIRDFLREQGLHPQSVVIHDEDIKPGWKDGAWHASRKEMGQTLKVLIDTGRLKVHRDVKDADIWLTELQGFAQKQAAATGPGSFGNDAGVSPHDDVLMAVNIACWFGEYSGWWPGPRRHNRAIVERITLVDGDH